MEKKSWGCFSNMLFGKSAVCTGRFCGYGFLISSWDGMRGRWNWSFEKCIERDNKRELINSFKVLLLIFHQPKDEMPCLWSGPFPLLLLSSRLPSHHQTPTLIPEVVSSSMVTYFFADSWRTWQTACYLPPLDVFCLATLSAKDIYIQELVPSQDNNVYLFVRGWVGEMEIKSSFISVY